MPVMTLDHAAAHLDLPLTTLHCWRASGHLVAVEHPCVRGEWLVDVQHLLEVDLAMTRGIAEPVALPPMTARALAEWLTQRTGLTVTLHAINWWVRDGDLQRVDTGGPGKRALYDPMRGAAVHAARTRRIPVAHATDTARDLHLRTATDEVTSSASGAPLCLHPGQVMTRIPTGEGHG